MCPPRAASARLSGVDVGAVPGVAMTLNSPSATLVASSIHIEVIAQLREARQTGAGSTKL